ncbi:hypothetical protein WME99_15990 [Sorangium sp. So ce136]|uniref:hypothetical protein n=1 Tax=Sorangium sp. So ce136 TaxID=3133284 RepID=UPI003F0DB1AB
MTHILKVQGLLLALLVSACGSDTPEDPVGQGGVGPGDEGTGGVGAGDEGQGGVGADDEGQGGEGAGGEACRPCSDVFLVPGTSPAGPDALCDASEPKAAAYNDCVCVTKCAAQCSSSACVSNTALPSQDCILCIALTCAQQRSDCMNDR